MTTAQACLCAWCGATFYRASGEEERQHCGKTHSAKMNEWRRQRRTKTFQPCPTPTKVPYVLRGVAVEAAYRRDLHFYLCRCGSFHLTKTPNDDSIRAIELLRAKVET